MGRTTGKMKCFVFLVTFLLVCFSTEGHSKKHRRVSKGYDGGKIVGGYNTTIQSFPYQVYLLLKKGDSYYQCGGSIINKRYVLTAAHCLSGISTAYIRTGSTISNSGGAMYTSQRLTSHPLYNAKTSDYDVGVIRVSQDMDLDGTSAKAVRLAASGTRIDPGTELLVSGWGATSENGDVSSTLMAVSVPTVSNADCRKSYGSSITSRMFCAGNKEGGKDSCQGDSGGPAVSDGTQLGIVSFGVGCARPDYPGVYTNVASVRRWIQITTGV